MQVKLDWKKREVCTLNWETQGGYVKAKRTCISRP